MSSYNNEDNFKVTYFMIYSDLGLSRASTLTLPSFSCLNRMTEGDSKLRPDITAPQNYK